MSKVAVIMGSDSDFPVVKAAIEELKAFGVAYEVHVMSAHRTPEQAAAFAKATCDNDVDVIIAAAGKAAHLAGVLAAHTVKPVIGIPVKSSTLVATVAIDGAANAAILAVQMLALSDPALKEQLIARKAKMEAGVLEKDKAMQERVAAL